MWGVFSKSQIAKLQLITPCETASLPEEEDDNLGHHDLEICFVDFRHDPEIVSRF